MSQDEQLAQHARTIIDSNRYMALGTADASGRPWVTPVWFASDDYRHFHWVSSPEATHSRNIAARPEVAIAIFDSSVPVGGAQAVYMSALAKALESSELESGIDVSSGCPVRTPPASGGRAMFNPRPRCGSTAQRPQSTSC